jgi:SUMO ligase MMS21 Smc5/6 complex component
VITITKCRIINGKKICPEKLQKINFNFLTDKNPKTVANQAKTYIQEFSDMALELESNIEGRKTYHTLKQLSDNLKLHKKKNIKKILETVRFGTDVCQLVDCDTKQEMGMLYSDLFELYGVKTEEHRSFKEEEQNRKKAMKYLSKKGVEMDNPLTDEENWEKTKTGYRFKPKSNKFDPKYKNEFTEKVGGFLDMFS